MIPRTAGDESHKETDKVIISFDLQAALVEMKAAGATSVPVIQESGRAALLAEARAYA